MSARAPLNEHLSDSAQRQLAAVRDSLEARLAELEDVLADPSRNESLEALILELSRAAAEEAQAAAAQVCLDIKGTADREMDEVRGAAWATLESAQVALEQEQIANSDLRRAIDQAQEHVETLERSKQTEVQAALEQFKADAKRTRTNTGGLEHEATAAHAELEAAQASIVELKRSVARAGEEF